MLKKLPHHLIPILAIILLVNLFFTPQAEAAINYSHGTNSFSLSFDSTDDLTGCTNAVYWLVNLGYNNGTEVQGNLRSVEFYMSTTDSYDIPDGTPIQLIQVWSGTSADGALSGECKTEVASNAGGIFNWTTEPTPQISNLVVSDVTSTSVTVTWDTDISSSSTVQYGTTSSYGSTQTGSGSTTSHSVSLTGLSANVTYHYNAKSTSNGGTGESGDNTFVTAASGTTGTTQTGTTTTVTRTRTVTPTPTPTPVPDRNPPAVSIDTDFSKPFTKPPTISGKASDASGISKVQYSIDDGHNWNSVDEIPNIGANFVNFTFTPPPLDDDNYQVRVRATDDSPAKNTKDSDAYTLIIDRLPPRIGGNIIAIGPQVLFSNDAGYFLTSKGVKQKIILSAVGGPTSIELLAYRPDASGTPPSTSSGQVTIYKLTRSSDNGLWSGVLSFDAPGVYQLAGNAIDGAGNTTQRLLNKIAVLEPGKVVDADNAPVANATITLYYFEARYQIWRVWDGPAYDQMNPHKTNEGGEFSYLVPSGKYYFDIQAGGFGHTQSEIFTVNGPTVLNPNFTLKPLKLLFDFGFFKLYFPDFSTATAPVKIALPTLPEATDSLIGTAVPSTSLPTTDGGNFNLFAARGTPIALTFLSLWSPQTNEQLAALDRLNGTNFKAYAVIVGDSVSKTKIFKQSGDYKGSFIVDSDATLVTPFRLSTIPTHYFIDRRGTIQKIVTGILSDTEIKDILLGIQ